MKTADQWSVWLTSNFPEMSLSERNLIIDYATMENKNHSISILSNLLEKAQANPRTCRMFPEKPCTLLTCHTKHSCLWTKAEVEAAKNQIK